MFKIMNLRLGYKGLRRICICLLAALCGLLVLSGCDDSTDTLGSGVLRNLPGTVTVSGNRFVGQTLTAVYSGNVPVTYQWNRWGNALNNATNQEYTLIVTGAYSVTVSAEGYKPLTSLAFHVTAKPADGDDPGNGNDPGPACRWADIENERLCLDCGELGFDPDVIIDLAEAVDLHGTGDYEINNTTHPDLAAADIVLIKGVHNGNPADPRPFAQVDIQNAAQIYIADGTQDFFLYIRYGSTITGGGSDITMIGIETDGDLTINGMLGNINTVEGALAAIRTIGSLTINGAIGDITSSLGSGIHSPDITISGTIGAISGGQHGIIVGSEGGLYITETAAIGNNSTGINTAESITGTNAQIRINDTVTGEYQTYNFPKPDGTPFPWVWQWQHPHSISLLNGTTPIGTAHTFTAQTHGYTTPSSLAVTVSNTGNQPTGNLTAALSGTNAGSFNLSDTSIESIAVDGSRNFTVTPNTGLAAGTHTAAITVSNTANGISAGFSVNITVSPANPTVNWPNNLTATFEETLSDITLPANNGTGTPGTFSWTTTAVTTTSVGSVGYRPHNMTFTPTDTTNYNTVTQDVLIEVNPQAITSAAITVTAPAKNATPPTTASGAVNFTTAITWSSTDGFQTNGSYRANRAYTATVTLTAGGNYTFPSTGFTGTINGDATTTVGTPTNPGVNANSVTLSLTFPVTERAVITPATQPAAETKVTFGSINATLTFAATIDGGATLNYRWSTSNETGSSTTEITGATNQTFTIPTNLTPGTYYYRCEALSSDAVSPGAVSSNVATVIVQQSAGFTISYAHITDGAPNIAGLPNPITISRGAAGTYPFTITPPAGVTYDEINWSIDGTTVTGTGTTFTLEASNLAYAVNVDYQLSLIVVIGGIPYDKVIPFRVVE